MNNILEIAAQNTYQQMVYFADESFDKEVLKEQAFTLVDSKTNIAGENHIISLSDTPLPTEQDIKTAIQHFKKAKRPFIWWIYPSADLEKTVMLEEMLTAQGLQPYMACPSMHLDLTEINLEVPQSEEIIIKCVQDTKELTDFAKTLASSAAPPRFEAIPFFEGLKANILHPDCPFSFYVLYVAGAPASVAVAMHGGSHVGIYYVGTHIDFRNRGLASLTTKYALNIAQSIGCKFAILQATKMATSLYQKLGFEQHGLFKGYTMAENGK